jgi:hypothetical protein
LSLSTVVAGLGAASALAGNAAAASPKPAFSRSRLFGNPALIQAPVM